MWTSNQKRPTPNLKQLKLKPKATDHNTNQPPQTLDSSLTTESSTNPSTWRKELKLTRVVERERKKLSTATASSCSTSTSYSTTSSRPPPTPSDLPNLDDRLSQFDEKLEVVENMFSARQQMFELLGKDSDLLNLDLCKEMQRHSQSFCPSQNFDSIKSPEDIVDTVSDESKATEPKVDESKADESNETETGAAIGWGDYFKKKLCSSPSTSRLAREFGREMYVHTYGPINIALLQNRLLTLHLCTSLEGSERGLLAIASLRYRFFNPPSLALVDSSKISILVFSTSIVWLKYCFGLSDGFKIASRSSTQVLAEQLCGLSPRLSTNCGITSLAD
ncbi:hypothetical protein PCASD_06836 [Puccinia coronata f. sp. avenae]|uniref:Uncharacterized protein n=1 Tax=Puccinia coronata f. sp. avenae TaxID=200324 RepID=A0A2N5UQA1_9BASI|nr:hypothetical protein PCASD_06836 [Puccinia coronata f. sp. avenae]